jgi:hypothetical protein
MDRVELISIVIGAATILLVALIAFFGRPMGRRLRRMAWAGDAADGEAAEPMGWFGGSGGHCDSGSHSSGDCGHGGGDGGGH